ncbi:LPXTG cell wall anchor domain-containing protein [Candidatus Enterococcus ikei]|uniref:LPXTG cell wall anchor domain-containing protein n=1 Tax=Candidatus Enterococcus ikei TaxID=2815326 RepID=A0ABS3H109_9ENTE|nr:LPXTG cell wall anchor domain-containing protein [Enterococcus sp. DIV0869a]MBO0441175.1 LPXTG cell wall anchor domain-containing protein [Enterococcus sp. DIV0869a]
MKKFNNSCLALFLLLSITFTLGSTVALAEGGEAGTIAEIEFYTDDSKEMPVDESKAPEPEKTKKPIGRFPNTGEIIRKSLMMSGLMLAFIGLWILWMKKTKRKDDLEL